MLIDLSVQQRLIDKAFKHLPELCTLNPAVPIEREKERGRLSLSGDSGLARSMDRWLRTSAYAALEGIILLS